jgi:hypothetical protein
MFIYYLFNVVTIPAEKKTISIQNETVDFFYLVREYLTCENYCKKKRFNFKTSNKNNV